jgi:hypothetical protein
MTLAIFIALVPLLFLMGVLALEMLDRMRDPSESGRRE